MTRLFFLPLFLIQSAFSQLDPNPRPNRLYDFLDGKTWLERHKEAKAVAEKGEAKVIFLGDSITHWWEIEGFGLESWNEFFGDLEVENLAYGGDKIQNLIWRLENGELGNHQPDLFILQIGTNNWRYDSPDEIVAGIDRTLAILRDHAPRAKIILHHLLPRNGPNSPQRSKVNAVNSLLHYLVDETYIFEFSAYNVFADAEGNLNPEAIPDQVHPSPEGYRAWGERLRPEIDRLLELETPDYFGDFEELSPEIRPLFVDPNTHGSCDPEIIFNSWDQHWYIYYTTRRPHMQNTFLGTPLGVIRSKNLKNWEFLGYTNLGNGDQRPWTNGTFWAPAIIEHNGRIHMFVSIKDDLIPNRGPWGGYPGSIIHYSTSIDRPVDGWVFEGRMHDRDLTTIDASIFRNEKGFFLWFKGKPKGAQKNELYVMRSFDLESWREAEFTPSDVFNEAATGSDFEEAPYVFEWKGKYWLITDPHLGLFVYSSDDTSNWKFQGTILEEPGDRPMDDNLGRHCSVAVIDDRAFIFYHVEPWRRYDSSTPIFKQPLMNRRAVLQMAELKLIDGKITCDRNAEIEF